MKVVILKDLFEEEFIEHSIKLIGYKMAPINKLLVSNWTGFIHYIIWAKLYLLFNLPSFKRYKKFIIFAPISYEIFQYHLSELYILLQY